MTEPILAGLLFADNVVSEDNGKKIIFGTFNRFFSQRFPVSFPPWSIYAAVSNLEGKHTFALNLTLQKESQVLVSINGEFLANRLVDVIEIAPPIVNAIFPRPDIYVLTFHVDGQQIGSRMLVVEKMEASGG